MKKTRILLVDDSQIAIETLSRLISSTPDLEVAGKFKDGGEALNSINLINPDICSLDFYMPKMDGLELTSKIMEIHPVPILIVSSKLDMKNSQAIFPLLEAGALDCIEKPQTQDPTQPSAMSYLEKLRILSKVMVLRKRSFKAATALPTAPPIIRAGGYAAIVIGSSTGGPTALLTILRKLPKNFPLPIVCVQHISKGFLKGLVEWLDSQCQLNIKIGNEGEMILPGHVYFPQEDTHLELGINNEINIKYTPPVNGHRPSIDVTMSSFAKRFGKQAVGVILTGMGLDGAAGILQINKEGGATVAQSEQTCVVFGMPKVAIEKGGVDNILDIDKISDYLQKLVSVQTPVKHNH